MRTNTTVTADSITGESFDTFTGPLMFAVSTGETKFHFESYYHIRYANYREGDGKGNQHKVEEKR